MVQVNLTSLLCLRGRLQCWTYPGRAQVLDAAEGWGAVMCLHKDGHGNVWAGFKSGGVGLWSRAQRRLACQPLQCCKSPVRHAAQPVIPEQDCID
jgi:hypothetical protein